MGSSRRENYISRLEASAKALDKELEEARRKLARAEDTIHQACVKAGSIVLGIDLADGPDETVINLAQIDESGQRVFMNVNDYVEVKLTEHGRQIYRRLYADLGIPDPVIKEDAEGWSRWQIHDLMNTFGESMMVGSILLPFETTIRFVTRG